MNNLDEIKRALFSASDLSDALAKLDAQRISYRECAVCENTYHLIEEDVTFWVPRRGHPLTLHVFIGDVIATAEYREAFFAQQQPELSKSVPAHDSPVAAEQLVIPEPSTDSVDKPLSAIQAALSTPEVRLAILRTERRLKNSRVKGLSS